MIVERPLQSHNHSKTLPKAVECQPQQPTPHPVTCRGVVFSGAIAPITSAPDNVLSAPVNGRK